MKSLTYTLIIGSLLFACTPQKDEDGEKANNWKYLIEGSDLIGWKKQGDFNANIENGMLTVSGDGQGGWLFYEKEFEDFIFETEFLVPPQNISGIAFRYMDDKKGDPSSTGYKVIIDHNPDQQNPMGSIFNISRAKFLKSTKTDSWNKLNIEAKGDHLKVFINDTLVTETHNRRSEEGLIGIQAYGKSQQAQFRKMKIKELEEVDYLGPQIEDYMRTSTKSELKPLTKLTNLDDWSQIGDGTWEINEGVIHGYSGEKGGFLIHKNAYRNFYLKLNFKITHEENSGIFIRHDPSATDLVNTDNAIECNIYDHNGFTHEYSTGSIAPISRAWSKMIDYSSWNSMEIFAFEDQICMYVNGVKSSEAHVSEKFNKQGNICIQGGIQVFNGNLPSHIYIKDILIKDFESIPFLGY